MDVTDKPAGRKAPAPLTPDLLARKGEAISAAREVANGALSGDAQDEPRAKPQVSSKVLLAAAAAVLVAGSIAVGYFSRPQIEETAEPVAVGRSVQEPPAQGEPKSSPVTGGTSDPSAGPAAPPSGSDIATATGPGPATAKADAVPVAVETNATAVAEAGKTPPAGPRSLRTAEAGDPVPDAAPKTSAAIPAPPKPQTAAKPVASLHDPEASKVPAAARFPAPAPKPDGEPASTVAKPVAAPPPVTPPASPKPSAAPPVPKPVAVSPAAAPNTSPKPKAKPVAALSKPPQPLPATKAGTSETARPSAKPRSGYVVQFASVRSRADAEREWKRLTGRFPKLLAGLEPAVQKARIAKKGTFYRVRAAGFESARDARRLCRELQAVGQGCLVVKRRGP